MSDTTNTFEFKAEAKQLLELMIHSVYSHKEIFLRELISNASDAIDKLRFESLTNEALRSLAEDLHIRIAADTQTRTLSIEDNGIGMNRDDMLTYLGTIAKSGTRDYLRLIQEAKEKAGSPELIGQFGVGFYSSFMVADKITVVSRKAGETQAWQWESVGDGRFTITEASRDRQGTTVTLHLKPEDKDDEEAQDFTAEWTIREIVRKYSDFVAYPIKMRTERTEHERDADGKIKEGTEPKKVVEDQTLNSMKAIWTRPEKEVTEEEYKEFYKHISHDWTEPMKHIVYRAEGAMNDFRSLLFLPSKAPHDLFFPEGSRGIHLYVKRVFIMSDCKELIPEYLRFVRGVVDSDDLSLNISREILQQNRQIQGIRKSIIKKVLDTLRTMLQEQKDKYLEFWKEFGRVVKEGLFKEPGDRDRIFEVTLLPSTNHATELTTLEEYVGRMKPEQKDIYYLTGESRQILEQSPHLEAFRDKGYEVLLLSDPVDEVWVPFTMEYKGKRFQNIGKGQVNLGSDEEKKKKEEALKEKQDSCKSLFELMKSHLSDHVKEVRLSSRLTSSPACLVSELNDMSPQLEQLLRASGKEMPHTKRILELNPTHPILDKMQAIHKIDASDARLREYTDLLFGQAILAEGGKPPEPAKLSKQITELLMKAIG